MEADVLNALKTQAAYLSGVRKRPLIIINLPPNEIRASWKKLPLDLCLRYLVKSLSTETINTGINVIIDTQNCSWRCARNAIDYIIERLDRDKIKLYAVRPEVFWDKQRVENCTKTQKYLEATFVTKSRLLKYFKIDELPEQLGGTLAYNHEQWLKNRIRIEDFRKSFNKVLSEMETFKESLVEKKSIRPSESNDVFKCHAGTNYELQNIIKLIIKNGNKLLVELNDSLSKNYCISCDIVDAKEDIKHSLNKLEQKQTELSGAWSDFERYLVNLKTLTILSEGISYVTKWILRTGEELISEQQRIGTDLESSEELRDIHDCLEMKCCDTYGYYAELNYNIKDFLNENDPLTANTVAYNDLLAQKQFMDFLCRSFANRLERRRIILITCIRFYRFVTTYFARTSQVFDTLIVGNKIDDFDMCIANLSTLRNTKVMLGGIVMELEKEGEKLSDILSMPVKDVLGRDTGLDYSDDIATIRDILDETSNRRKIFCESVELQIMTLEQIAHTHTYETDAMMAVKWMDDLLDLTITTHSHIGCDLIEIQRQKLNLQMIQETAKRIFTYGSQLLDASLALRSSCKLNESDNREKAKNLKDVWNHLNALSQEQMTRLRVSAVFHRTMEEQCQQLKELKETVEANADSNGKEEKLLRLRSHLLSREQLIVDIGRMVRLGRLLKSRLKEPFGTNKNNGQNDAVNYLAIADNNMIATNAITGKLNEVSKIAEALDIALRETQNCLEMDNCRAHSLERKTEGNTSIDSRESTDELNSIAKLSTEDESFLTASECTFTPQSHSSAYETASEGGLMSPWWASSGTDKNSFETCSSSDMDSEVPSMQLLCGVISSATTSFDESEHSFLSTLQSPFACSDEDVDQVTDELAIVESNEVDQMEEQEINSEDSIKTNDDSNIFVPDRSSWSLVTKQTVKGCL